jgi:hypothetical protein
MARLSENPDRDFSAGYDKAESDVHRLLAEPPARLEDVFDSPAIREYVGKLIANTIRKSAQDK